MPNFTEHEQDAYDRGADAAEAAASWILDGNATQEHYAQLLAWLDDGDPRVDDYFPAYPNLSGEWSDDLTPNALALEIIGGELSDIGDETIGALADAYEQGVADNFMSECERLLRAAIA